ncbi:MAG TPA: bifunctional acetate--CoA ligase family protein/GNAT family N-acetyltransferase [Myxococcota bacterium]|nr:bifunctional acetate--CoA ligase family protein/GNAT family N-acetyltransferase [Myxococcota bacterium]
MAVIGASNRERSVGAVVIRNLLRGGFAGPVMPVNPKHRAVAGVLAYPDVASLPLAPDLAVIATRPGPIPELVDELGRRGTRAAVVLTALPRAAGGEAGADVGRALLEAAGRHRVRILGPNCLGLLVPGIGLDASFAHVGAIPGRLAFVSQSGALCTAVLDWAHSRGIGFSHFVSLGNSADVDVGDVLDFLGGEAGTQAILIYLESITAARKFMSAGRAAARNKPVIVIKSGRVREGARAAASHTGALAGADDVADAAFRRAGMLRVDRIDELFDAAETLARSRRPAGDRLLVVTNGGGPAVMAADFLVAHGGKLAELSDAARTKLDAVLPETWSRDNPVDIIGDAPGKRYADALRILLAEPGDDAVLALHAPTAIASSEDAAKAVADAVRASPPRAVLASWLGGAGAEPARRILGDAGIPSYETPEDAARAFLHIVSHRRSQEQLIEAPPSPSPGLAPRRGAARALIASVATSGRELLTEPESKALLKDYGIPSVETRVADDPDAAVRLAVEIGFPVALKIVSKQVTHKTDVGGVALELATGAEVREAARAMAQRVRERRPDATLDGFAVQPLVRRPGSHELIVGAATDPVFGPLILFGQGGTAVEQIGDRAVGLPPLNTKLAHELIGRTRVARLLEGHRGLPGADRDAIAAVLVALSELVVDLREVLEIDVNPLLADARGVLALDARVRIARAGRSAELAIRPYPAELEETIELPNGMRVVARPIRPEDEPAHRRFFARLSADDVHFRFFSMVRELPQSQVARFTQIDYEREMAFIAYAPGDLETLGVVRAVADPDNRTAEFAVIVRSDLKGLGLGRALLEKMIRYCRARGTGALVGQVLADNHAMRALARDLGFQQRRAPADDVVEVRLELQRGFGEGQRSAG